MVKFEQRKDENGDIIALPLVDAMEGLEIRLGGILGFKMSKLTTFYTGIISSDIDHGNTREPQMGGVMILNEDESGSVFIIYGRFGPVLRDDYLDLDKNNIKGLKAFANNIPDKHKI